MESNSFKVGDRVLINFPYGPSPLKNALGTVTKVMSIHSLCNEIKLDNGEVRDFYTGYMTSAASFLNGQKLKRRLGIL